MVLKPLPPPAPLRSCDIWEAATKGDDASISRLVEQGVQVDATDDCGYTAIMKAAANGRHATVDHLIAKGADVNVQSRDPQLLVTALHCAAINDHPRCAELLIRAGADTRLRDGASDTALDWARRENFREVVWLLEK